AKAFQRVGEGHSTLAMLAYHFYMAIPYGSPTEALHYTLLAAEASRKDLGYEDAVSQYERALEIAGNVSITPSFHCELLLSFGEAQAQAGLWMNSRETFAKAAAEARALRQWSLFAKAAIGFKGLMGSTIPMDAPSVALLREALVRLGEAD